MEIEAERTDDLADTIDLLIIYYLKGINFREIWTISRKFLSRKI